MTAIKGVTMPFDKGSKEKVTSELGKLGLALQALRDASMFGKAAAADVVANASMDVINAVADRCENLQAQIDGLQGRMVEIERRNGIIAHAEG